MISLYRYYHLEFCSNEYFSNGVINCECVITDSDNSSGIGSLCTMRVDINQKFDSEFNKTLQT